MSVYELIQQRRSIRRFLQKPISRQVLEIIVDAGRLAPSASNKQPLEYIIVDDLKLLASVFAQTRWAGYSPPNIGPPPSGQEPMAYIVILKNQQISDDKEQHDSGAAIENMILVALEHGIGSCWIGSLSRQRLQQILSIPNYCVIDSVLALGYPNERPVVEKFTDSVKYWRDEKGVQHVPKRSLKNVLHINSYGEKNG